jgi:hypothetical protein
MFGFPKHLNTEQDYYHLLEAWPPLYADIGGRAKMTEALDLLVATAVRPEPIWPDGHDPDAHDQETDVQPVAWSEAPDPNGKVFAIGFDLETVAKLRRVVEEIDPWLEAISAWGSRLGQGHIEDVLGAAEGLDPKFFDVPGQERLDAFLQGLRDILGGGESDIFALHSKLKLACVDYRQGLIEVQNGK